MKIKKIFDNICEISLFILGGLVYLIIFTVFNICLLGAVTITQIVNSIRRGE